LGPALAPNTTVEKIEDDATTSTSTVTLSQPAVGNVDPARPHPPELYTPRFWVTMVDDPHAQGATPANGDLTQVEFATDVRKKGWARGMPVTGVNIGDDTTIKKVDHNGTLVTLSHATTSAGPQSLTAYFDYATGTTSSDPANSKRVTFDVDVLEQGWRVGMPIAGKNIAADTIIDEIADGGHHVTLSNAATGAGTQLLTVYLTYEFSVTLSKTVLKGSPGFSEGVHSTIGTPTSDLIKVIAAPGRTLAVGTVQWSGEVLESGDFSWRGIVNSGVSGQTVGQIWLRSRGINYARLTNVIDGLVVHFPAKLTPRLNDDSATASYWDSLPSCDTITAAQKQGAVDAISLQNQFQTFFRP